MGLYKKTKAVLSKPILWLIIGILVIAGIGWWLWDNMDAVKAWFKKQAEAMKSKDKPLDAEVEATVEPQPTSADTEADQRGTEERM